MKRKELQGLILRQLERGDRWTVDWRVLGEMLDDPNERIISGIGVSTNEAILLAGGRPAKTERELFDQWCADNEIEWYDEAHQVRTFHKSLKEKMRQLLVEVAALALRWPQVGSVEISLESRQVSYGPGWDGRVRLRLIPDLTHQWRDFGYIFSATELDRVFDLAFLVESFKRKFDAELMRLREVENGR